jgi:hypothetical protein
MKRLIQSYSGNVVRFIPAIVFLLWARLGPGEADARWGTAYEIGGAIAVVHAAWMLRANLRSAIPFGVDLYLIIGGALSLGWPRMNQVWGAELGAASVLGCVLVVQLLALAAGWLDPELAPDRARTLARQMIGATIVATGVAIALRHNALVGGALPIIGLVVVQAALRKRAAEPAKAVQ